MEFKYTEITMCLTLGLTCVVNGDRLVKLLIGLLYSMGRYIVAKDPLGSGSSSFKVLP